MLLVRAGKPMPPCAQDTFAHPATLAAGPAPPTSPERERPTASSRDDAPACVRSCAFRSWLPCGEPPSASSVNAMRARALPFLRRAALLRAAAGRVLAH